MSSSAPSRIGRPPGLHGQELLDLARVMFLERGFERATMHDLAAQAGVSKASLYREHGSKDGLFVAVVTDWAGQGRGAMRPHLNDLLAQPNLVQALEVFAAVLLQAVLSPDVSRMRKLVAAESERFPQVASLYYRASWCANIAALAEALGELDTRGALELDDPAVAAEQLVWLVVGGPLNARTLSGDHDAPMSTRHVPDAVKTFLARYGPDQSTTGGSRSTTGSIGRPSLRTSRPACAPQVIGQQDPPHASEPPPTDRRRDPR